ncbi:leucine-rich repeat domain-containing protein [Pseudobutyrivibrio sp. MD2005]|uniref:leucine-rich repeat domain-containing protein n=1 Tax=Pseudobutyrivibrio sp. MD2005 TaxID=1410616 RepID=UPI00047F3C58|nr:leucine-rich repeat domain-containing protein [Pseudobutyrivibrio sp. MD2005]
MQKVKKIIKYIPVIIIILIVGFVLLPFIHPIEIYSPSQGIYFEVHGTYAVAVDYDKAIIKIPERFLFMPVTETDSKGARCKGCDIVEEIEIPDTVTLINVCSFNGYHKLKRVSGGKNVRTVCNSAFQLDDSLSEIPYFENVELIEEDAFTDCNIRYLKLPQTIKEIDDRAFANNQIEKLDADLNNVKLGAQVFRKNPFEKEMGEFVIYPDNSLQEYNGNSTTIVIPDQVTAVMGAFDGYGEDMDYVEIYVPDSVEKIGLFSFWTLCDTKVYIPESVHEMKVLATGKDEGCFGSHPTIVTTKGSYAEQYAKEFNIDYEIVDEIEYPETNVSEDDND